MDYLLLGRRRRDFTPRASVSTSITHRCVVLVFASLFPYLCLLFSAVDVILNWFRWDFLKNNYKTQTIPLVSKRFKLISFITIRVQWTRFRKNWCGENMEIEFNELGFHVQKPSSMNSFSIHGKRVHWTHFPWTQLPWVCFRTVLIRCLYFIELGSHGFAWSSSAEDRWLRLQIVQRTRFLFMENKFIELVFHV